MPKTLVELCRKDSPEANRLVQFAQDEGRDAFLVKYKHPRTGMTTEHWCIEVGDGGEPYRAPDAEFGSIRSGLYVFKDDQIVEILNG